MSKRRASAKAVAKRRGNNGCWIDHARLVDDDVEWLAYVEKLTLWNVVVPPGFLSRLEKLWWLDYRGGSAADLSVVRGTEALQYLAVNQVRGLSDLSSVAELGSLRFLSLYGLAKVTQFPSLARLKKLERVELGQLRSLCSLAGLLEAPDLRELQFSKMVTISDADVDAIVNHSSVKEFGWFAEDVPNKTWVPVVERIGFCTF